MEGHLPGLTAEQVLGEANASGMLHKPVSARQLHRWQQQDGPLPGPVVFRIPGQRGTKHLYSSEAPVQLVEVANTVARFGDLNVATWRLFFTHDFVPMERILGLLRRQIERIAKWEYTLDRLEKELLETMDDPAWRWVEEWEEARSANRFEGLIRRRFGRDKLRFMLLVFEFATGGLEFHEYKDTIKLFQRVVGSDFTFHHEHWAEFGSVVSLFKPEELTRTLDSYDESELLIAKNEATAIVARRGVLRQALKEELSPFFGNFLDLIAEERPTAAHESELHAFLMWLALRRRPEFRLLYVWTPE
jgi:hypothetical protein